MTQVSSPLSRHAKAIAILWLVVIGGIWISERGFQPMTQILAGAGSSQWWRGKTFAKLNIDFENNLTSFQRLRPYYNWAKFWTFGASNNTVARGKNGWMFYPENLQPPHQDSNLTEAYLNLFHKINLQFKAKGFVLWLVPVPEKGMIYPDHLPGGRSIVAARLEHLQSFSAAAKKRRIGVVDLVTPFLAEAQSGPLLFLPDDTHWTDAGAQRAAEITAATVEDAILRNAEPLDFEVKRITRTGDLANMLNFPQPLLASRHQSEIQIIQALSRQSPKSIWFGTSFSRGFSMAHRFSQLTNSLTANESTNGMLLPDFFPAMLAWLEQPGNAQPGTHVMVEFPYRHLNEGKGLADIEKQLQWRQQFAQLPPQRMIDPRTLAVENLKIETQWLPQNSDPMIFLETSHFQGLQNPWFLRVRVRTQSVSETPPTMKAYYDLGSGFSEKNTFLQVLSRSGSWQSHWIPILHDRKMPQRIRLDIVNRQQNFQLDLLAIF